MNMALELIVRSSAVVLVGLTAAALLRNRSAALRHAVLAAAIFCAALTIPLASWVPSWHVPLVIVQPAGSEPEHATVVSAGSAVAAQPDPEPSAAAGAAPVLAAAWAAGFLACAGWLVTGLIRLSRVTARARPVTDARWTAAALRVGRACGLARPIVLLHTDRPDVLATWGCFRPAILLPAHAIGWSDARMHAVLSHELAHVRRHDWTVQMAAELLRTVAWFNPLMWAACSRLRGESERAADDAVLEQGVPAREYAGHLLDIVRTCRRSGSRCAPAMTMARASKLEERIAAMLNVQTSRAALSRRSRVVTIAVMFAIALPIAAIRAEQGGAPLPLTGTIYDPTGAVMPDVELTLEGAGDVRWRTKTGADGRFEFAPIQPGRYALAVTIAGFGGLREEIELTRARDWERAITLQVGQLSETIHVQASRGGAPPAADTPRRVRVGGNIRVPRKVHDVKPVYPESMRAAGLQGMVPLEAIIGTDGAVHAARVLGAHVHPDFAAAALAAVRGWSFTPTLLNGEPVEVSMMVTVTFSLEE